MYNNNNVSKLYEKCGCSRVDVFCGHWKHKQNATQPDPVDIRLTTTMDAAKSTGATRSFQLEVFYVAGLSEHLARVFESYSTT